MYFIQPFAYFVLIVQVVLARSIESFHAPDALSSNSIAKRWIFNINGFPVRATGANPPGTRDITAEDVDRYIDQVAELSRLIVDNVRADDAIFLQFFGSADYYDNVMSKRAFSLLYLPRSSRLTFCNVQLSSAVWQTLETTWTLTTTTTS